MKIFLKFITSFFLLFNGIGALYGGANLIMYRDGSSIQLSMEWLRYTPFHDYLIPGIILFIFNGISSICVLIMLIIHHRYSMILVFCQGIVLIGWLLIQILLIRTVYYLHFILGFVGFALILLGWIQIKYNKSIK